MTYELFFYIPFITKSCFRIVTDCEVIKSALPLVFGQFLFPSTILNNYQSFYVKRMKHGYCVEHDHKFFYFNSKNDVMIFLGKTLHTIVVTEEWLPLHGFSLVFAKTKIAIALIGSTHSGKSTLGSYLINNGFDYLSDDFVLLNVKSKKTIPLNRPIRLREPSIDALSSSISLNNNGVEHFSNRILYFPKYSVNKTYNFGVLYFIKYGDSNSITFCSPEKTKQLLLKNIFSIGGLLESIQKCEYVKDRVLGYQLNYSNLSYALDEITKSIPDA